MNEYILEPELVENNWYWKFNRNRKRKCHTSFWNLCHCPSKTKAWKLWWGPVSTMDGSECQTDRIKGSEMKWSCCAADLKPRHWWEVLQDGTGKLWLGHLVCTVQASKWQMSVDQMGQNAMGNGALGAH